MLRSQPWFTLEALALCALLAWSSSPMAETHMPIPPEPVWQLPTTADMEDDARHIAQQERLCASAPSPSCALRLAELRGAMAVDLADRGEPDQATPLLDEVIAATPLFGAELTLWVELLNDLADQIQTFGSRGLERTLRDGARLATARSSGAGSIEHTRALLRLAAVERDLGLGEAARGHAEQALDQAQALAPEPSPETATAHLHLGAARWSRDEHALAREHLELALAQRTLLFGEDSAETAEAHLWLGDLIGTQGDRAGGEDHLSAATRILEQRGDSPALLARVYAEHADVVADFQAGRDETVSQLAIHGLDVLQRHGLRDRIVYASLWNSLALVAARSDDVYQSIMLYKRAILANGAAGLTETEGYATLWHNYGSAMYRLGRLDEALQADQRAVEISRHALGDQSWGYATMLRGLASGQAAVGMRREARENVLVALAIQTAAVGPVLDEVSERVGLGWLQKAKWTLYRALSIVETPEDNAELWSAVITWKGAARAAATRRHLAALDEQSGDGTLRALIDVRRELSALTLDDPGPSSPGDVQRVHALLAEQDRLERSVTLREDGSGDAFRDVPLDEVCRAVPAGVGLIQFVLYKRMEFVIGAPPEEPAYAYLAFIAPPGQCEHPVRFELGPAEPINTALSAWLEALTAAREGRGLGATALVSGARLRALIWDPLASALGDSKQVYIMPDSALERVPFAGLPLADGRVLVEALDISTLDSARDLLWWARRPPPRGRGALMVGDVAWSSRSNTASAQRLPPCAPALAPLPGARAELRQVGWRLRRSGAPTIRLTGEHANEARISAMAPGVRVLHLATHGFAPEDGCTPASKEVPSALAGLVVSGAGSALNMDAAADDGLWSAEEIASLDLREVALVVLSACSTGRGMPNDMDGASSLRRAFAIAGAREIVYTLGPVSDADTVALIDRFYYHYTRIGSAASALTLAQRDVLNTQRRQGRVAPTAWAGFAAMGHL